MKNKLFDLLKFITRKLILKKEYLDFCLINKINPDQWPDCNYKNIAVEYIRLREIDGHHAAAVQLSGYLDELENDFILPEEANTFAAYYRLALKEFNAKLLAKKILENPDDVEKFISEFQTNKLETQMLLFAESFEGVVKESIRLSESGEAIRIIPNWPLLSEHIGGFNPGRVGLLMAATGFGKTTAAANLALCAMKKFVVNYFNMEMITQDFAEKLIMSGAGIDFKTYKRDIAKKEVQSKVAEFYADSITQKLYFSDGKSLSPQEIFAICRRQKLVSGLDFVVIDYDQKLSLNVNREMPEWKALQVAVEQFEVLAKELECYILILAQESGEGEISGSKRSKFPASTVLRFYKNDDGVYLIECLKNRFGKRGLKIEVDYVPEKGSVKEKAEYIIPDSEPVVLKKKARKPIGPIL